MSSGEKKLDPTSLVHCNTDHLLHSHGNSEELVLGGGDDHVGLTQDGQKVVSAGQEAPVENVRL